MKSYLITDPKYYGSSKDIFRRYLEKIYLKHTIDYTCFRDKKNSNFKEFIPIFLEFSDRFNIKKSILNGDPHLADSYNFFGVHLRSNQFDKIEISKKLGLFTTISTHSKDEVIKAKLLGADAVTISPIFDTPDKGKALGASLLSDVVDSVDIDIFALGGVVSIKEVDICQNIGSYGFASIRYFVET